MKLKQGMPLIIYGYPDHVIKGITSCHAWNIDGYKIKQRDINKWTYNGNHQKVIVNTGTETMRMVHCDFGWGGERNGYYVSGVFDMTDDNVEFDPESDSEINHYYKFWLKMITYNKPNI